MKIEKTTTMILIVILMLGLINGLMSCKVVYNKGNKWDPMSKQSEVTGWYYTESK